MPVIVSFDVGIKNMSFCVLQVPEENPKESFTIREWGIMTIEQGATVPETGANVIQALDERPYLSEGNFVIIENQPVTKNPKMKTIQVVLLTYFLMKKRLPESTIQQVLLLNSALKLKAYVGPTQTLTTTSKSAYIRRKNLVVLYCLHELRDHPEKLALLKSHKKKDDLSDAFLQALYVVRKSNIF